MPTLNDPNELLGLFASGSAAKKNAEDKSMLRFKHLAKDIRGTVIPTDPTEAVKDTLSFTFKDNSALSESDAQSRVAYALGVEAVQGIKVSQVSNGLFTAEISGAAKSSYAALQTKLLAEQSQDKSPAA